MRLIEKLNEENFNLWKFKMEIVLVNQDVSEIVEDTKEPPSSNANSKVKKAYDKKAKITFLIIACTLIDKQVAHIRVCKRLAHACRVL